MRSLALPALTALAILLSVDVAAASRSPFDVQMLDTSVDNVDRNALLAGALDHRFESFRYVDARKRGDAFWLRLRATEAFAPPGVATLNVHKGRHLNVQIYATGSSGADVLRFATSLPAFRGAHEAVFILPSEMGEGQSLYVHVQPLGTGAEEIRVSASTLSETLARGERRARMIALTIGALIAMALTAMLIWFVLSDQLLVYYSSLFSLQALYVAYLSGFGFDWPVLQLALPAMSHAWNVPAALSGAAACLFVREIAELRRFSPGVYRLFGWFAGAFVVLSVANLGQHVGLGPYVAAFGNLLFLGTAVFTLVVAFLAWRRNNRAAGWFLLAWGLLETFTIATAVNLLVADMESAAGLLYYGLPLSMVAAAVLIALGVADRLRDQRIALTEAERRAQTDPLTGVLNRRSLIDRLEGACVRARARGLPIALLFIDLDHFKEINDTFGHAAGDACLKAIIGPIQSELRQSDVIGRYGGEEFVVILSSADGAAAQPMAERIRERVAEVRVKGFGEPINLTCSIGVATSDTLGVWGEHLIASADAAVYAAKRSGRNCVQVALPLAA